MKITDNWYSFEIPERLEKLVKVRKRRNHIDLVLSQEEDNGCSGLLVTIKCLKRKPSQVDDYTEFLGYLTGDNGESRYLYAAYGKEGSVSEENEDLYWRVRDKLCPVFDSISPAAGKAWHIEHTAE